MHCCSSGSEGLYIVWHSIVTKNVTGVYVNLALNRDTKWVLVNSYRPYQDKVEIIIHEAPTLFVRVPDWTHKADIRTFVDNNTWAVEWRLC